MLLIKGGQRNTINGKKWFCCEYRRAKAIPFLENWIPTSVNIRMNGDYKILTQEDIDKIEIGLTQFYSNIHRVTGFPVTLFLNGNFGNEKIRMTVAQQNITRKLCIEYSK